MIRHQGLSESSETINEPLVIQVALRVGAAEEQTVRGGRGVLWVEEDRNSRADRKALVI